MKKLRLLLLICSLLLPTLASAQQKEVISAFQEKWDNSEPYLLTIAKKMPAEDYDFKPTDRQMTFREQLLHTRENMLKLSHRYIAKDQSFEDTIAHPQQLTKARTIKLLDQAFKAVDEIVGNLEKGDLASKVDFFEGTKTKLQILNLIQDHVTHHRGQIIVYLNLKGLKPPEYVGW